VIGSDRHNHTVDLASKYLYFLFRDENVAWSSIYPSNQMWAWHLA